MFTTIELLHYVLPVEDGLLACATLIHRGAGFFVFHKGLILLPEIPQELYHNERIILMRKSLILQHPYIYIT